MGIRILEGKELFGAMFYDSVTDTPFGVLMKNEEEAEEFQKSVSEDLRSLTHSEFELLLREFRRKKENEEK